MSQDEGERVEGLAGAGGEPAVSLGPTSLVGPERVLDWEEMTDVIDLALWTGKLMLELGASAARVEQTVALIGTSLGCDELDILVSPNVIMATTTEGRQFRTKARRIGALHVDLARIVALGQLASEVATGQCRRLDLRARLTALDEPCPAYPRWFVALAVGVACAAFSRLFGGDWLSFAIVLPASGVAMAVRQQLGRHRLTPVLNVLATAFVATLIAAAGTRWLPTTTPQHALAASVLLLVPGVPLINAFEELVRGYTLLAVARGVQGLLVAFAIALGLLLAMNVVGVVAL